MTEQDNSQASDTNESHPKPTAPGYYWAKRDNAWELVMVSQSGCIWIHGDDASEDSENLIWGEFVTGLRD